jgi:hypothetical protein
MQLEHEAIYLRFRKRVGSFLLYRILCREHQKRLFQNVRRAANGDLLLLHRFEQCGLNLRWCAIYLVRENDVREDRALLYLKQPGGLIVHLRAYDVRGQEVRCELDPLKRRADRFGERAHRQRFRETRNALEQHMAAREQTHEQPFDHVILAYYTLANFAYNCVNEDRVFHVVAV